MSLTATGIREMAAAMDARLEPAIRHYVAFVHREVERVVEHIYWRAGGGRPIRHGRSTSARGRKARLMAAWHPRTIRRIEVLSGVSP